MKQANAMQVQGANMGTAHAHGGTLNLVAVTVNGFIACLFLTGAVLRRDMQAVLVRLSLTDCNSSMYIARADIRSISSQASTNLIRLFTLAARPKDAAEALVARLGDGAETCAAER